MAAAVAISFTNSYEEVHLEDFIQKFGWKCGSAGYDGCQFAHIVSQDGEIFSIPRNQIRRAKHVPNLDD